MPDAIVSFYYMALGLSSVSVGVVMCVPTPGLLGLVLEKVLLWFYGAV